MVGIVCNFYTTFHLSSDKNGGSLGKQLLSGPAFPDTGAARKDNRLADCIARKNLSLNPSFHFWDNPPTEIARIMRDDGRGISLPRCVRE
ncbi:hypothetical protein PIB30_031370 [Stylosanthes scabra]|uniref:Uncharacterized protein n=1 Tax=Stylosanthes scabra TaxID=79078 RepID=A0ABU6WC27_9FABA|nr:hypothetical protein [Stylosanthes scabra]